jgi:putative heme-binding domain-containing protein
VCYLERQFPDEYRGNLFFCEWGRSVVRYPLRPAGAGFAPLKELVFAAGADTDPYGFKPTDLVVERDGSLMVSDWADGQRPNRGRIYRIRRVDAPAAEGSASPGKPTPAQLVALLDSDSLHERDAAHLALEKSGADGAAAVRAALAGGRAGVRARLHAVWLIAGDPTASATERLLALAGRDPEPRVQAQAVRALADRFDPALTGRRPAAGDAAAVAARLESLPSLRDQRVMLEAVIALGRWRRSESPAWLARTLTAPDATLAHAARRTMRRSDNPQSVLRLLDRPVADPIRAIALRAVFDQATVEFVDGLIARSAASADAAARREYADALSRMYKRPGPWTYWGYRPAPRPANTVAWERTEAIAAALDVALTDPDPGLRTYVLERMLREKVATNPATLGDWLKAESDVGRIRTILTALREHPPEAVRGLFEAVITSTKVPTPGRLAALAALPTDTAARERLAALAGSLQDGPVLAEALRRLAAPAGPDVSGLLLGKLESRSPEVRAAALDALAAQVPTQPNRRPSDAVLRGLLEDRDAGVRRAAAAAVGRLGAPGAAGPLAALTRDLEPAVRRAALDALVALRDGRAVAASLTALDDSETQVSALRGLAGLGGPEHAPAVLATARRNTSAEVAAPAVRMLIEWSRRPGADRSGLERAAAELQALAGTALCWRLEAPVPAAEAAGLAARRAGARSGDDDPKDSARPVVFAVGVEARVTPGRPQAAPAADAVWTAYVDLFAAEAAPVQFLAGAGGGLRVWLNGNSVFRRDQARAFAPDSDRFDGALAAGWNRVLVQIAAAKAEPTFHLRFRRRSTSAEHEKLTQAALTKAGNVERGRKVFLDVEKSQCLKCHRLNEAGERIGPELTGIGNRFSRIHLIESVLEPSRTIASSYRTWAVALADGRVFTGVLIGETETTITLADNQGRKTTLARADIAAQKAGAMSTMPDGLEKKLTVEEFTDLMAFLAAQRDGRP